MDNNVLFGIIAIVLIIAIIAVVRSITNRSNKSAEDIDVERFAKNIRIVELNNGTFEVQERVCWRDGWGTPDDRMSCSSNTFDTIEGAKARKDELIQAYIKSTGLEVKRVVA